MADRKFGFAEDESSMDYYLREGYKEPASESLPTGTPTEVKLTTIDRKLSKIIDLLGLLTEISKQDLYTKSFNTGTINLPNAVIPAAGQSIDPANTNPITGYTVVDVNIQLTPNRNVKELYFLNRGPGTIFVIVSHVKNQFIGQEFPVFARNATIFSDVYELRVRTSLANTLFVASEHPLTSLPSQNFGDRDVTPRHITLPFSNFGPHGQITRRQYTVPTGFQAQISGVYGFIEVSNAAGVPLRKNVTIGYLATVSGIPINGTVLSVSLPPSQNTAGDLKEDSLGFAYLLQEGETIVIATGDLSTGGLANYFGSILISEYFPIG